jgi:hypothetical protein
MARFNKPFDSKRNQIIAVIVVVAVAAIVIGVIHGQTAGCSGSTAVDKSITGKMLGEDPGAYKCKVVTLSGQVFNTEKQNGKNAWQVWTDPENSENGVLVYFDKSSGIGNNDYITFTGPVGAELTGENAFGGNVNTPTVNATWVGKVGRDEAVAPALKTITPNVSQTVSGVTVTVTKIEFAASETRLYVAVKNDSASTASIYDFDTKIVQGSSQVKSKTVYDSDSSSELPSDIVAHTTEKGEMYFQKADPTKPLSITMQGYSQGDYQDLNFTLAVDPAKS